MLESQGRTQQLVHVQNMRSTTARQSHNALFHLTSDYLVINFTLGDEQLNVAQPFPDDVILARKYTFSV